MKRPQSRARRRWRPTAVATLGVIALLGGGLGVRQWAERRVGLPVQPPIVQPVVVRGPGAWRPMAASPITTRRGPAGVWTGRELLVWGGVDDQGRGHADGAAYDPAGDTWRRLPPSPLSPRSDVVAVWTGTEMLVWGGQRPPRSAGRAQPSDGAAYDPARGAWRRLPPAPLDGHGGQVAAWTGSELVVVGGYRVVGTAIDNSRRGAAYDPVGDRWRRLPDAPFPLQGATVAVTDDEVLIWGSCLAGEFGCARAQPGLALDPARNRWREVEPDQRSDVVVASNAAAAWSGREVVLWGGNSWLASPGATASFDPRRRRLVSRAPGPQANGAARLFWTGTVMLALGVDEAGRGRPMRFTAYDPAADRWRALAAMPVLSRDGALAVWTGSELLVWGGLGPERDRPEGIDQGGARWRPTV